MFRTVATRPVVGAVAPPVWRFALVEPQSEYMMAPTPVLHEVTKRTKITKAIPSWLREKQADELRFCWLTAL
jgi:hypothetical protein